MELDVTHMVDDADDMPLLSGSVAELGVDAGRRTWNNSVMYGRKQPLLKTENERDAARDHFKAYGAWAREEIDAWSENDLQGIMCQDVAAAIREMEPYATYEEYEQACQNGEASGRLWRGTDGRWYFDING